MIASRNVSSILGLLLISASVYLPLYITRIFSNLHFFSVNSVVSPLIVANSRQLDGLGGFLPMNDAKTTRMLRGMVVSTSNVNGPSASSNDLFPLSPTQLRALLAQQNTPAG
jgi:hypothetical protein